MVGRSSSIAPSVRERLPGGYLLDTRSRSTEKNNQRTKVKKGELRMSIATAGGARIVGIVVAPRRSARFLCKG